ncbi:MAG: hypothetical protein AAB932_02405 [Patescibacteria group bacterium]
MWFPITIAGYFLLAIVFVLDKLILTKSLDKPVVYTFILPYFYLPHFWHGLLELRRLRELISGLLPSPD